MKSLLKVCVVRFSVRFLIWSFIPIAVVFAAVGSWLRQCESQANAIRYIRELGGDISFDTEYKYSDGLAGDPHEMGEIEKYIVRALGKDRASRVSFIAIHGGAADEKLLRAIGSLGHVETLLLFNLSHIDNAALQQIENLGELRALKIQSPDLDETGIEHLSKCRRLEQLHLRSAKVDDNSIRRLARLQALNFLDLNTAATSDGIRSLRKALPGCAISDAVM